MNSSFALTTIDAAMAADATAASTDYLARWREDMCAYVAREQAEAVRISGRTVLPPVARYQYHAHLDAAGGSGADSMTAALAHTDEEGRAVLDVVLERRPPFSPAQVTSSKWLEQI